MAQEIVALRENSFEQFNAVVNVNDDFYHYDFGEMSKISNFAYPVVCKNRERCEWYKQKFIQSGVEIRPVVAGSMVEQPFFKEYLRGKGLHYNCPNVKLIHEQGFYFPNHPELNAEEKELLKSLLRGEE